MLVLHINNDYYKFPNNISSIEEFMLYVNQCYNSFIPLIQYQTDNCIYPYFIAEDVKTVYVNLARVEQIYTEDVTVIPTCKEYDDKLKLVVQEKCIDCRHYTEGDNLSGHRDKLSLDGECWGYEKKTI